MNIRNITLSLCAFIAFAALAISPKLDLPARHFMAKRSMPSTRARAEFKMIYLPTIIAVNDGFTPDAIEELGAKVLHSRGDLVLAFIPENKLRQVASLDCVRRLSIDGGNVKLMDKARPMTGVDKLIDGSSEFPTPWTGKGVVAGLTDLGFDPNHANFINPDGTNRVKRIVNYNDTLALVDRRYSPELVKEFVTDNQDEWHATHVAGIMAGSYRGNDYYGIAEEADIACSTSSLYDACILDGLEEIVDYAKSVGKPAVVNMSLGSYTGPHDGTSLFCQYLDRVAQDAIICLASGNEGEHKNNIQIQFDNQVSEKMIFVSDRIRFNASHPEGVIDFWSADATPFEVSLTIYDLKQYKMVKSYPLVGLVNDDYWEIASPGRGSADAVEDEFFNECYDGFYQVSCGVDPDNGRYRVYVTLDLKCRDFVGEIGRYYPTLTIKGAPGTYVDGFADGSRVAFSTGGRQDFVQPNSAMTVSDLACAHNVICVGAASSRATIPLVSGSERTFNIAEGNAAPFTGYGSLLDGRTLPHIASPGNYVVSSVSTPYLNAHPDDKAALSVLTEIDGRETGWIAACGTSMATPYVSGLVALMLQADPSLTVDKVRDILIYTATNDAPDADNPRWGAGLVDAVAAMREVIRLSSVDIPAVDSEVSVPAIALRGRSLSVTHPSVANFNASVYRLDGSSVGVYQGREYALDVDLTGLANGVYLLVVNAPGLSPYTIKLAL